MNKELLEILDKNTLPDHKHMRTVAKKTPKTLRWTFAGYCCSRCEKLIQSAYVAKKHICQPNLARKTVREHVPDNIKTVSGKPFVDISKV